LKISTFTKPVVAVADATQDGKTTVGKTYNAAKWLLFANAALAALAVILQQPSLFDGKVMAVLSFINIFLVFITHLLDNKTPTV